MNMPGKDVSTSKKLKYSLIAFSICLAGFSVYYSLIQAKKVDGVIISNATHEAEYREMRKRVESLEKLINDRLVSIEIHRLEPIESALFGQAIPKIAKMPPVFRLEQWSKNRDTELRTRIAAMEQWRYKVETQLQVLQKELKEPK
jgi:hypothetical protein